MIETQRLILKPLSYSELSKQIDSPAILAEEMGFTPSSSLMDSDVTEAIQHDLLPLLADANNDSLFYTLWLIIEKNKKTIIGGFCFHGKPDIEGEVKIGYGIDNTFRNHGYMTEAINGIIQWVKRPYDDKENQSRDGYNQSFFYPCFNEKSFYNYRPKRFVGHHEIFFKAIKISSQPLQRFV